MGPQAGNEGMQGMMAEMPFHMALLLAVLFLLGLLFLLLFLFFRRPAGAAAPLAAGLNLARAPLGAQETQPADPGGNPDGREQDCYLIVPDISGYTAFMAHSRFSVGHAQHVISQLLGAMIDAAAGALSPAKIEGDSILFFAAAGGQGSDPGAAVFRLLEAFYAKRQELLGSNLCPCRSCRSIEALDLKVVVHRGPVLHYKLGGFSELGGLPVIVVHRLLKNRLALDRYVLVTAEAHDGFSLPFDSPPRPHSERYEGVGSIKARVYPFEPGRFLAPEEAVPSPGSAAKAKDLLDKLSANARTLGQAIRPG